jgi:hypothetical protein
MRRMIQILLVLSLLAVGLVASGAALSLEEPPTPRPQVSPDSVGYRLTPAEQEHLVELGLDPQEVADVSIVGDSENIDWRKVTEVVFVLNPEEVLTSTPTKGNNHGVQLDLLGSYYLTNVGSLCCEYWAVEDWVSGYGPGTLTYSSAVTSEHSFSANVGVSASVVTAGVGFDVTWSNTHTDSFSTDVPAGQCKKILSIEIKKQRSFDVWANPWLGSDYYAGSGSAHKSMGRTFVVTGC